MNQIKQHTLQSGERILFVSVPSDAYNMEVMFNHQLEYTQDEPYKNGVLRFSEAILLPTGNWQLIGLSDEITEKIAKELVEGLSTAQLEGVFYKNYSDSSYSLETALESFKSLMQSLGCEGRYAVLREVK